jgi:hypothetical protein
LLGQAEELEGQERAFVSELTRHTPTLQTAQTLAQDFLEMILSILLLALGENDDSNQGESENRLPLVFNSEPSDSTWPRRRIFRVPIAETKRIPPRCESIRET